jgi:hypothetical protein
MAEQEMSTVDDDQEALESEDDGERDQPNMESGQGGRDVKAWAIRGAVIGAATGSAAGAGIGAVLVSRPEVVRTAKEAFEGSGKHVARAVATAVSEVLTSRSVKQLLSGSGNGDRTEVMKDTAKEAGAAAATAARDSILALRSKS